MQVTQIKGKQVENNMISCFECFHVVACRNLLTLACNLIDRPPTVFEVMSDLLNNDAFNPITPASECHMAFMSAIDCSHEHVVGLSPATPQRFEDLMVSIRSDLLRIITRWEQSGQGKGGRDLQKKRGNER
jgi:hypothetical protein